MGEVFKAWDPVLKRFVAIKIISANLVSDDQFRRRFVQEAVSAAQLNHRNIVTVFEFNEDPRQVFLVMEFLEGHDLREAMSLRILRRVEDKLGILEQVCEGLAYAHSKGIVHRDLKPANIRLLPNLTPKIMDFGLARLGTSEITRAGTVMGTPDYMSPEQVRAEEVDARSDIFSIGAVLYHLLSGRKPFEKESVHSILYEVLEHDPPPLRELVPDLPPLVVPIVEKALRKDPARRYPSASALRDALRDARRAIAAGRAAAAAMTPGGDDEATITRIEAPSASYPSLAPTAPSLHGRSGVGGPPSARSLASPPTIAIRSGSIVQGATALDMPYGQGEGSTERPAETILGSVHDQGSLYDVPPSGRGRVVLVGAMALLLLGGTTVVVWRFLESRASEVAERKEGEDLQRLQLLSRETQLDLARSELAGKNYQKAREQAEAVLAEDPGSTEAASIVAEAQKAVAQVEVAAAEARLAVAKNDTASADAALSRVLAIDPRHPVVAELSQALNQVFRAKTQAARSRADQSRRAAQAAQGAGQPAFAAADQLLRDAEARLGAGQFVEAARGFSEAADGYDRARREGEVARAAQARTAEAAKLTASIKPSLIPTLAPSLLPSLAPPTVVPAPTAPASASPPLPSALPTVAAAIPSPSAAPTALPAAAADAGVRRALADYSRAFEARDLALFKSVMPGLTSDQEKAVGGAFKAGQRVALTVESVQLAADGRATVRLTRQDTVAGQAMKPRQQTFRLAQRGAAWVIESIGQ